MAKPGDVLVVYVSDHYKAGYWGEVMSTAAKARGLNGLVIDGSVRDGELLEGKRFPVFARGLCIRATGKDFDARGERGMSKHMSRQLFQARVSAQTGVTLFADAEGIDWESRLTRLLVLTYSLWVAYKKARKASVIDR